MHVGDPVVQHYGDHLDLVGGEVHSWGAAHGPLWDALRKKGRQVRVIGIAVENATVDRTARVLEAWAAAEPGTPDEGLTVKREIKAIDDAMTHSDENCLARYGGFGGGSLSSSFIPAEKAWNSPQKLVFSRGWARRWAPSGPGELSSSLRPRCSRLADATNTH